MIRSSILTVGPSLTQIAGGCYGFAVSALGAGSAAFPVVVTVTMPDGLIATIQARAGIYYQLRALTEKLEALTADGSSGTVIVDTADDPLDFVNAAGFPAAAGGVVYQYATVPAGNHIIGDLAGRFPRPGSQLNLAIILTDTVAGAVIFNALHRLIYGSKAINLVTGTTSNPGPCLVALFAAGMGLNAQSYPSPLAGLNTLGGTTVFSWAAPDAYEVRWGSTCSGVPAVNLLAIWW